MTRPAAKAVDSSEERRSKGTRAVFAAKRKSSGLCDNGMATYTTKSGDMWDSIAYEQLGGTSYTDQLINANPSYHDTYLFPSGIVLALPEVKTPVSSKLPPWKRRTP